MNGNGNLCRAIVRAGAPLGIVNKQGLSIFNTPVASKQLLFKLLGKLPLYTIVRAGAPLGIVNKQGLSIFNTPVASKQLLFKLLGKLSCTQLEL